MNEVRSARRVRLLAILVLIAAFTAGALVGVAADRTVTGVRATPSRPALFRGADPPARSAPRIFAPGLVERLDLTPEQVVEIDSILAADREKARGTFDEFQSRLRARIDSTSAAVRAVLDPEQQAEFDRIYDARRERRGGRLIDRLRGGRR